MDEHFTGHERVWCWVVPPTEPEIAMSLLGTATPDTGLQPVIGLRSSKTNAAGRAWKSSILDVTGPHAKKIGWIGIECDEIWTRPAESFSFKITEGRSARAYWDGWGRFEVEGEKTTCTMATRGMPVPERGPWYRKRADPVVEHPDVVDAEAECFDGWLRARQVHDAESETWAIEIDAKRARPVSLALALTAATGALCHRRATLSVARA